MAYKQRGFPMHTNTSALKAEIKRKTESTKEDAPNSDLEEAKWYQIEQRRKLLKKGEITQAKFDADVKEIEAYTDL